MRVRWRDRARRRAPPRAADGQSSGQRGSDRPVLRPGWAGPASPLQTRVLAIALLRSAGRNDLREPPLGERPPDPPRAGPGRYAVASLLAGAFAVSAAGRPSRVAHGRGRGAGGLRRGSGPTRPSVTRGTASPRSRPLDGRPPILYVVRR